jgi:hypothetical protein
MDAIFRVCDAGGRLTSHEILGLLRKRKDHNRLYTDPRMVSGHYHNTRYSGEFSCTATNAPLPTGEGGGGGGLLSLRKKSTNLYIIFSKNIAFCYTQFV